MKKPTPGVGRAALASLCATLSLAGCAVDTGDDTASAVDGVVAANTRLTDVVVTNYYTPHENQLNTGRFIRPVNGLTRGDGHYRQFLCAVALNGSGKTLDGTFIRRTDNVRANTCESATFGYTAAPVTQSGTQPTANYTLAVNPDRITVGSYVYLETQCRWYRAEDRCPKCIRDYNNARVDHIDLYTGGVRYPSPPVASETASLVVSNVAHAPTDPPPFCGDHRCDPCEAAACPDDCRSPSGGGYVPPPPLPEGNVGCGGACNSFLDCGSALFCDASNTCAGFAAETCPTQQ